MNIGFTYRHYTTEFIHTLSFFRHIKKETKGLGHIYCNKILLKPLNEMIKNILLFIVMGI